MDPHHENHVLAMYIWQTPATCAGPGHHLLAVGQALPHKAYPRLASQSYEPEVVDLWGLPGTRKLICKGGAGGASPPNFQ